MNAGIEIPTNRVAEFCQRLHPEIDNGPTMGNIWYPLISPALASCSVTALLLSG